MYTDRAGKRLRFAPPREIKPYTLNEYDIDMLAFLGRHRKVPSTYLHRASGRSHRSNTQHRLTKLSDWFCKDYKEHGQTPHTHTPVTYLSRPSEQFIRTQVVNGRFDSLYYKPIIYGLTDDGKAVLKGKGIPSKKQGGWFVHQLMEGCIGGSVEFALKDAGYTYRTQFDILERANKPSIALPVRGTKLIADDLTAIVDAEGSAIVTAWEYDRASEGFRIESEGTDIGEKLDMWVEVLKNQTYKEWAVPRVSINIATTTKNRADAIQAYLHEKHPKYARHFRTKDFPWFTKEWTISPVIDDVLKDWLCDGKLVNLTDKG